MNPTKMENTAINRIGVAIYYQIKEFMEIKHLRLWEVAMWSDVDERKLKKWLNGKNWHDMSLQDICKIEWMLQKPLITIKGEH